MGASTGNSMELSGVGGWLAISISSVLRAGCFERQRGQVRSVDAQTNSPQERLELERTSNGADHGLCLRFNASHSGTDERRRSRSASQASHRQPKCRARRAVAKASKPFRWVDCSISKARSKCRRIHAIGTLERARKVTATAKAAAGCDDFDGKRCRSEQLCSVVEASLGNEVHRA